jgi:hypothetical protein
VGGGEPTAWFPLWGRRGWYESAIGSAKNTGWVARKETSEAVRGAGRRNGVRMCVDVLVEEGMASVRGGAADGTRAMSEETSVREIIWM